MDRCSQLYWCREELLLCSRTTSTLLVSFFNQTTVFSNKPFPVLLCFFSLSRLLRAETSACSVSTRRSLSSTSPHAFCPTQNTQAESQCVWIGKQVQTHFLLLLTCSSDCSDSFILFTSLTSLSCPLDEKNLALEWYKTSNMIKHTHQMYISCSPRQDHTCVSSWRGYNLLQKTELTPSSTPAAPVNPDYWPAQGHSWSTFTEEQRNTTETLCNTGVTCYFSRCSNITVQVVVSWLWTPNEDSLGPTTTHYHTDKSCVLIGL